MSNGAVACWRCGEAKLGQGGAAAHFDFEFCRAAAVPRNEEVQAQERRSTEAERNERRKE
jgi:hypothetical protein